MNKEQEKAPKFEAICKDVLQWAGERELLKFENAPKQALKVLEELGEFAGAYLKGKELEIQKEFGDVIVTVVVLLGQLCANQTEIIDFRVHYIDCFEAPLQHVKSYEKNTFGGISKAIGDILLNSALEKLREKQNNVISLLKSIVRFARLNNLDALQCLELAYQNIKDRQGKTENGVFIKQEDY